LSNHFGIKKPLISYHQHSKIQKIEQIIDTLKSGKDVALVSDAGTPGISDPGATLINRAYEEEIKVIPVPGVSALTTILSISGLEASEFTFYGFLPTKKGRQTKILEIVANKKTSIIYESPYRIKKLLKELLEFGDDRMIMIGRELTKKFEETYHGKISKVLPEIKEKGEFVVIYKGKQID
jgi:16S rRNA (cytidine1402-2'-O)-methyltransferase